MKVSLVIPTLEEAGCIETVLSQVPKGYVDEILVVDAYSKDGTADIVRRLGYKVVMQEGRGFGDAFSLGVSHAKGDVIILMDGDGSHNPADIPKLLAKINEGYAYVLASRYCKGSKSYDDTMVRHIGNKFFTFLICIFHNMKISDSLYLFTAIRKEVFDKIAIKSKGFEYCVEILVKVHKSGFKMEEIPSVERKRYSGYSKVRSMKHGLKILIEIFKSLSKNYK